MFRCELNKEELKKVKQFENMINNKQIPYRIPRFIYDNWALEVSMLRGKTIPNLGFVMITWKWVNELARWINGRKCLEIMSGTGALCYALRKKNVDIIATDNFSWNENNSVTSFKHYWTDIEKLDAIEAVKKYGKNVDIIIMSWAYMDDTGYRVLKQMHETNPDCIMLYIGEGYGGCTANDNFFENLLEIKDKSFKKVEKEFFQWSGLHDYPSLVKFNPHQQDEK